jgi:RNA polymerase sigma-70 factor (ECF subfamily)
VSRTDKPKKRSTDDQQLSRALADLMKCAQTGDSQAYRELLTKLNGLAQSFVRAYQRRTDEAEREDVVQEILLAVHNKRHSYDPDYLFLPWFYAIARYKIVDRFRSRAREPISTTVEEAASETINELNITAHSDLENLMNELPEKQRLALRLIKLEGLAYAEAAAQMGVGESDVKVSVHRAIKALRKRIQI